MKPEPDYLEIVERVARHPRAKERSTMITTPNPTLQGKILAIMPHEILLTIATKRSGRSGLETCTSEELVSIIQRCPPDAIAAEIRAWIASSF